MGKKQDFLESVPFFSKLLTFSGQKALREFDIDKIFIKKNRILLEPGSAIDKLIIIKNGVLRVYCLNEEGWEITHGVYKRGDVLGEDMIVNSENYPYFIEALTDATYLAISKINIWNQIRIKSVLLLCFFKLMQARRREAEKKIMSFSSSSVAVRLAKELISLSDKFGINTQEGIMIDLKITHRVMASLIGSSRETVSLSLSEMKDQGIIQLNDRKITICNLKKLESYGR